MIHKWTLADYLTRWTACLLHSLLWPTRFSAGTRLTCHYLLYPKRKIFLCRKCK